MGICCSSLVCGLRVFDADVEIDVHGQVRNLPALAASQDMAMIAVGEVKT